MLRRFPEAAWTQSTEASGHLGTGADPQRGTVVGCNVVDVLPMAWGNTEK